MKSAHDETNDILQDFMSTTKRMETLNTENHRMDAAIECLVSFMVIGIIFTGLVLLYWSQENATIEPDCSANCIELEMSMNSPKKGE